MHSPVLPRLHAMDDVRALQHAALRWVVQAAERAIQARGAFQLVLAGGQTPRAVYELLRAERLDWERWHVRFGDERCLPRAAAERNSRMASVAWLDHVPIPPAQVHVIAAELGAQRAAAAAATDLAGVGDFDLVLLGLGEDGHTASLFPGHDWGVAADAPDALAVFDAPKPPAERVSLSAARLSRTREALFLVASEDKRSALARWRAGEQLPASAIAPPAGSDVLVLASLLAAR